MLLQRGLFLKLAFLTLGRPFLSMLCRRLGANIVWARFFIGHPVIRPDLPFVFSATVLRALFVSTGASTALLLLKTVRTIPSAYSVTSIARG